MMTIILLVFLYQSVQLYGGKENIAKQGLDLATDATNVLLLVANSEDCLAYKEEATQSLYANVIDAYKLLDYTEEYANIEPECARSYAFGWRITVREITKSGEEGINKWSFGAKELTQELIGNRDNPSFKSNIEYGMPAAIRYSREVIKPAVMDIILVDGEIERMAGIIDWACQLAKQNKLTQTSFELKELSVNIKNPIRYDAVTGELCSVTEQPTCRQMLCSLEFEDMDRGEHRLRIEYVGDKLIIKT